MFRKIFVILVGLLFLASPVMAQTDYFWDSSCGTPGDGTTGQCDGGADDAFDNVSDYSAVVVAGDVLWMRRAQTELFAVDLGFSDSGTAPLNIYYIGWPRHVISNTTLTSATWTNGSITVDLIVGVNMDREQHQGRWATGPDGFDYLITDITDANTVIIDRPYVGTTTSGGDGKFAIKADELPRGVTEPADPNNWDADADDLPTLDGQSNDIEIKISNDNYLYFYGINFIEFTDGTFGLLHIDTSKLTTFEGCLFKQSGNEPIFNMTADGETIIIRSVLEGDAGADTSQRGLYVKDGSAVRIKDSAIYALGDNGILLDDGTLYLGNVNIGVEVANGDADLSMAFASTSSGRDVKLGGTNGLVSINTSYASTRVAVTFANPQKVLGDWKMYYTGGIAEKVAVIGVTPNKKLSDYVIEITPDVANTFRYSAIEHKVKVYESRKTYDAGTYNIKVWIYNDTGNTLNDTTFSDDICMRCRAEARSYGDADTEYVSMPWIYSDEIDILDAANADDWDYLQCDSVVVGHTGSKIYCEILISTYDAQADNIFIDPETSNP